MRKRTNTYIATIPMKNEEQVLETKKVLEQIFGWVVLRGRHRNRKSVLGNGWHRRSQNDIPWRKAQYIDVYLHPKNENYLSVYNGKGIKRQNTSNATNLIGHYARVSGMARKGLADFYSALTTKKIQTNLPKLQPGDWGYIVQELIDFVERQPSATHTELHNHYRKITNGSNSFSPCLRNLRNADPNRRCKRWLVKNGNRYCKGVYIVKYLNK